MAGSAGRVGYLVRYPWPATSRVPLQSLLAEHVGEAHRERGSLEAGPSPASLQASSRTADTNSAMDAVRVPVLPILRVVGMGGLAEGDGADPLPFVPSPCESRRSLWSVALAASLARAGLLS